MPINALTGLMGSGKSYECVSEVILNALAVGRRIVTNVDGIDNEACRAYVHEKRGIPLEKIGEIIHCTNDDVKSEFFFPFGTDAKTFCQSGDMVCIDEAWRFWGTSEKIHKNHLIFFREHRHYVNPESKVSCDLVLMVQDISDLHRTLKVVVELTFKTTKIKSLGLSKVYRVEMWEGYKLTQKNRVKVENKKYNPEIFPLYSSYSGGQGNEVQIDKRQNILKNKTLWGLIALFIIFGVIGIYGVWYFFSGQQYKNQNPQAEVSTNGQPNTQANTSKSTNQPDASEDWRIAGSINLPESSYVILTSPDGRIRLESPSCCQYTGLTATGAVDGQRVNTWSAPITENDSNSLPH